MSGPEGPQINPEMLGGRDKSARAYADQLEGLLDKGSLTDPELGPYASINTAALRESIQVVREGRINAGLDAISDELGDYE